MRTTSANAATVRRDWFVVDATDQVLGRLAAEIARRLRGKHKPQYTPNADTGDYIVVVNAAKVRTTGRKVTDKVYYRHTDHIDNMKATTLDKMLKTHPERIIEIAVKGMLPKNALGRKMFSKLHVYTGTEHDHSAQQPQPLTL